MVKLTKHEATRQHIEVVEEAYQYESLGYLVDKYGADSTIFIDTDRYGDYVLYVRTERLETDEEFETRKKETLRLKTQEAEERREQNKLAKQQKEREEAKAKDPEYQNYLALKARFEKQG